MLNKNQRSEIDMRVAQELKNNQDFIYETNQSIQTIGFRLIDLSSNTEKQVTKLQNELKNIQIEFEKLSEKVNDDWCDAVSLIRTLGDVIKKIDNEMQNWQIAVVGNSEKIKEVENELDVIVEDQRNIESNIDRLESLIISMDRTTKNHINASIDVLRNDMKQMIPSFKPLEEHISLKIAEFNTNFEGLMKEIRLLKTSQNYNEKKFENIYTLIHRLQDKT